MDFTNQYVAINKKLHMKLVDLKTNNLTLHLALARREGAI